MWNKDICVYIYIYIYIYIYSDRLLYKRLSSDGGAERGWAGSSLINMNEHLMPHVIARSVFHSQKDVIKMAWKQNVTQHFINSGKSSVSTARQFTREMKSREEHFANIRLHTHYILLNLLVMS